MKRILPFFEFYISSVNKLLGGVARYAKSNPEWHLNLTYDSRFELPAKWSGHGVLSQIWPSRIIREFLRAHGDIPMVAFDGQPDPSRRIGVVKSDNWEIGRIAAKYFLSCGHANFCWYGAPWRERSKAFAAELKRNGVETIFSIDPSPDRSAAVEWLQSHMEKLPLPCAVFCENDSWAREAMDAAFASRLEVPAQIAILGVDNEPALCESAYSPLSSIEHRLDAVGFEAASLLDMMIEGETPPKRPMLIAPEPWPVLRGSTDVFASGNPNARAAIAFMRSKHRERIEIADVAKAACISESGLRKLFAKSFGRSPKEILTDMRLSYACALMRSRSLKMEEVAAKSGFGEYQRLHSAFKSCLGCSPSRFRSQTQNSSSH